MKLNVANLVIESRQSVDDIEDSPVVTQKLDDILHTDVSPSESPVGIKMTQDSL